MAVEITDQNFEALVLRSDKPVILDLWAEWCPPCHKIGPIVEALGNEYEGKVMVGKMNVDLNPNVSVQFGVRNIPTILYFRDGKLVDRQVGFAPKDVLAGKLAAHL